MPKVKEYIHTAVGSFSLINIISFYIEKTKKFNIFGSDTIQWLVINYSDKPTVRVEVNMFASHSYIQGIAQHLEENKNLK